MSIIKLIVVFFILFASAINCYSQPAVNIDRKINENKSTIVIREIKHKRHMHRDSSEMEVRFFHAFCRLIKQTTSNTVTFFRIDQDEFKVDVDGRQFIRLKKGTHILSLIRRENDPFYSNFSPIKDLKLKLKKRHYYRVDVFLTVSFMTEH